MYEGTPTVARGMDRGVGRLIRSPRAHLSSRALRSHHIPSRQSPGVGRALLIPLLSVAAVQAAPSRAAAQEGEYQSWTALFLSANLDAAVPSLRFWFDGHARRSERDTLLIIRPALGLRLVDGLDVHVGYAWVPRFNDDADRIDEHRIWQQLLWSGRPVPQLSFAFRPRLEQRLRADAGGVGLRFRFFARGDVRFDESVFLLAVWDEVFIHLNEPGWGPATGFDQNRVFFGPGIVAGGWRAEIGYLSVFLDRPTGQQDTLAHVLAVNFFGAL